MTTTPLPPKSPLLTRSTGPFGNRLVATQAVAAGEVLIEAMEGVQVPEPGRHTLQVGRNRHLEAPPDSPWRDLNHACEPTARLEAAPGTALPRLVARTGIAASQEVTINYLTTEWSLAEPFACHCGATTCVGQVRGARHLTDAQRDTLASEFLPHLQQQLLVLSATPPWYRDAFSITDAVWYRSLDAIAEREVEQALHLLELRPGADILDLCCGHGRHAHELARRGFRVTGLDLSSERLGMARERALRDGTHITWVEADMRAIPTRGHDAAILLSTSFGILEDDAAHLEALHSAFDALAPDGQLLIQTDNRDHAIRQPPRQWGEDDMLLWWEENRFDPLTSRNHRRYSGRNLKTGKTYEQRLHYRLFCAHELGAMLEQAGLRVEGCWGGLDGQPLTLDSPELVLRARRPR